MRCRRSDAPPRGGHSSEACRAPSAREWSSRGGKRARFPPRLRQRCARAAAGGVEPSRRQQQGSDDGDEGGELLRLRTQLPAALVRDLVELGFASELRRAPIGFDPAIPLHAVERWIERAFLDAQRVMRLLAEPTDDRVAVARTEGECLENERV